MCVVGGTAKLNRIIIRCHTFNFKRNPYPYVFLIPPRFSLNPCIFTIFIIYSNDESFFNESCMETNIMISEEFQDG